LIIASRAVDLVGGVDVDGELSTAPASSTRTPIARSGACSPSLLENRAG
jgi:hypothetical protein